MSSIKVPYSRYHIAVNCCDNKCRQTREQDIMYELPHYVKYYPHMNFKFDYSKINNILMSPRYTYSIYSDHCLAHVAVNMLLAADVMFMIINLFQIAIFRILLNST